MLSPDHISKTPLDHDDLGQNPSKIMNLIDPNNVERDRRIGLRNLHEFDCAEKPASAFSRATLGQDFSIRQREKRDAPALFQIFNQPKCRRALASDPFESADDVQSWFESQPQGNFELVATKDNTPIGFASLQPCPGAQSHSGWISLFIHDAFHGHGIGTIMLKAIIATADLIAGLRRVQLIVLCENQSAILLYRTFGFHIEGRHEWFCRRGDEFVSAFTMARVTKTPLVSTASPEFMHASVRDLLSLYRRFDTMPEARTDSASIGQN
jgi:putative acetyltransferase